MIFIAALLVALAIAARWWAAHLRGAHFELRDRVAAIEQQLARQPQADAETRQALETLARQTAQLQASLDGLRRRLTDLNIPSEAGAREARRWSLMEAEYRLLEAQRRRLALEPPAVIAGALKAAKRALLNAKMSGMDAALAALDAEITAVSDYRNPGADAARVELERALARLEPEAAAPATAAAEADAADSWLPRLADRLKGLVVLHSDARSWETAATLRHALVAARGALLAGDAASWRALIAHAQDAGRRLEFEDKELAQSLKRLGELEIAPVMPPVGAALDAVVAARRTLQ